MFSSNKWYWKKNIKIFLLFNLLDVLWKPLAGKPNLGSLWFISWGPLGALIYFNFCPISVKCQNFGSLHQSVGTPLKASDLRKSRLFCIWLQEGITVETISNNEYIRCCMNRISLNFKFGEFINASIITYKKTLRWRTSEIDS